MVTSSSECYQWIINRSRNEFNTLLRSSSCTLPLILSLWTHWWVHPPLSLSLSLNLTSLWTRNINTASLLKVQILCKLNHGELERLLLISKFFHNAVSLTLHQNWKAFSEKFRVYDVFSLFRFWLLADCISTSPPRHRPRGQLSLGITHSLVSPSNKNYVWIFVFLMSCTVGWWMRAREAHYRSWNAGRLPESQNCRRKRRGRSRWCFFRQGSGRRGCSWAQMGEESRESKC